MRANKLEIALSRDRYIASLAPPDMVFHVVLFSPSGKAMRHNRKTKQHNTTCPKQSFFNEKLAASGGTHTHSTLTNLAIEAAQLAGPNHKATKENSMTISKCFDPKALH